MTLSTDELRARADRAVEASDFLDDSLGRHESLTDPVKPAAESRMQDAHRALRLAMNATPLSEDLDLERGHIDLAELIWEALCELHLSRAAALDGEPAEKDPATEYVRLLALAEKAALESGGGDRARALAEVAGRWLSPELTNARKRSPEPNAVTHFGSPGNLVEAGNVVGLPTSDPAWDALRALQALDLDPEDRARYLSAAAAAAAAAVPLSALSIVAVSAARGHFTETDMLDLRTLLNRPARPAHPKDSE